MLTHSYRLPQAATDRAPAQRVKDTEPISPYCVPNTSSCLQPGHPYATVTADSGPRRMKETLQAAFRPRFADLLVDGEIQDIVESM